MSNVAEVIDRSDGDRTPSVRSAISGSYDLEKTPLYDNGYDGSIDNEWSVADALALATSHAEAALEIARETTFIETSDITRSIAQLRGVLGDIEAAL